jgi:sugar phosphate permease
MGFWCTNYQVGGLVATLFCTWLLSHFGYRSAFFVPAICMAGVGLLVAITLRPGPYSASTSPAGQANKGLDFTVLSNTTLWSYGAAYFFIKLIRYSLLFWFAYYLHTALGLPEATAGYMSTAFPLGGAVGAASIGLISDKLAHIARSLVAAASLVGLATILMAYAWLSPPSLVLQYGLMAIIGALLFGPDSLVSAAAAQEAAAPAAAATATGFVNAIGSAGAILQGYVTVKLQQAFGWSAVFYAFVAFALFSAVALAPTFRVRAAMPGERSA